MQIVIDDYGLFLGKTGNRFIIENKDKKEEVSCDSVDQIMILKSSSISTDAVKLAMENNIDIVYLDHFGMPYARVYPCKLGGTTLTRRKQAESLNTQKSFTLARQIVEAKIKNQIYLLQSLGKTRSAVDFSKEITSIQNSLEKLSSMEIKDISERDEILGIEGFCSSVYFSCLSKILPFTERQHEAKDPFNCMLNYGYGILYSEIEKACILAGIDPYLGLLHSDRYGKPSMVLDIIESFRQPLVDRAIITLFVQKQVKEADTEVSGNSIILSKSGKAKVVESVLGRLHTKIEYRGQKLTFQGIILDQCRSIARYFREDDYIHKPFSHRW